VLSAGGVEGAATMESIEVAKKLALSLDDRGQEYAIGGAIALGFWGAVRGTVDVDLTIFLSPDHPSECVALLQDIGCSVSSTSAIQTLLEYGYCRVLLEGIPVDVFLPTVEFYEAARQRKQRVLIDEQPIEIWDAETLAVFKLMFFRRKDIADLEQILANQRDTLDRDWITRHVEAIFGRRDPRVTQWRELIDDETRDE